MSILIIGFQRSGTTLLRRLIHIHPDVQFVLHERRILKKKRHIQSIAKENKFHHKTKDVDCIIDTTKEWGEKVPWFSKTGSDVLSYVRKYKRIFSDNYKILHIYRNEQDVANSNHKTFNMSKHRTLQYHRKSLKRVREKLSNDERYMEISFEELVTEPKLVLSEIFKFCNLSNNDDILEMLINAKKDKLRFFNGINPNRAYAYKKRSK